MSEARRILLAKTGELPDAKFLGGITRPMGCVFDDASKDLILIGQVDPSASKIQLDDFVVAMRAVLKHGEAPLVSIDPAPDSSKSEDQVVRFAGKVENTQFGKDLLDADVVLKKLGLGKIKAGVWGTRSYFELSEEDWRRTGNTNAILSRFWFLTDPAASAVATRSGVGLVKRLKVKVDTQVAAGATDPIGAEFAGNLTAGIEDLMLEFPELRRLDQLYRLVGAASLIERWQNQKLDIREALAYWLENASVVRVETPSIYPLISSCSDAGPGRNGATMTVSGGVELRALVADVRDGSLSALRDLVLKSRPHKSALSWEVPIGDALDELVGLGITTTQNPAPSGVLGAYLQRTVSSAPMIYAVKSAVASGSGFRFEEMIAPTTRGFRLPVPQPRVGGVMLSGVAKAGDGSEARVDLSGGNFSLVVDGESARLDPKMYRKFVTALWSVYFGRTDPGLSIDPIYQDPKTGDFSPKHMVRYIGRVVNTDLGRVMRETDYIMKKWSVGTERPDIPGFKNPDDYSGKAGTIYSTLSRFWLTPENMKFKTCDNTLMFDGGHMTVKTEILGYENGDRPKNPHNEAFAKFFTEHYDEIAAKYPVYQDLSDYGRLVALSKYLKDSGIPLLWFLMANKDLILTEDSPGTVDNLAKKSAYWEGMSVQGGVDMTMPKGQFVYDADAIKAIDAARQQAARYTSQTTSLASSKPVQAAEPFSFGLGTNRYTVTPQHSLTCGKDRHGIRYQTDFCLRAEGYKVTDDVVELLKSELLRREMRRLLEPMMEKLSKDDDAKVEEAFRTCRKQAGTTVESLQNRVEGLKGKTYETEEQCASSWNTTVGEDVPVGLRSLFVTRCHYVSNLEVIRYFNPVRQADSEFGKGWRLLVPYTVHAADNEKLEFKNVMVPRRMVVMNELTGENESLEFSTNRYSVAGYVPLSTNSSKWVGLFILTDASFRLVDKVGSEFSFDTAGSLTDMVWSDDHHIHLDYLGKEAVAFKKMPYLLEEMEGNKVKFRGHEIAGRISIVNLVSKASESFKFDPNGELVGYVPETGTKSAYRFCSLMTDGSFRLEDKLGNEVHFTEGGVFDHFVVGQKQDIVKAVSSGGHKVEFDYALGGGGQLLVAGARLKGDEGQQYAMNYKYDSDDRLCEVKRINGKGEVADSQADAKEPLLAEHEAYSRYRIAQGE